ncbi:MAG: DUF4153 domain-containing protein [Clostridiaceae bacterium]|nr:DUF4153 domain-containing protein [Clostridiaceae bacterium]
MRRIEKIGNTLKGLNAAVSRFPVTAAFLLAIAILNSIDIADDTKDYFKYILVLIVGSVLGAVFQVIYERFFYKSFARLILTGTALLLTFGYYLIIEPLPRVTVEAGMRTIVALFVLFIAFLLLPVVKSRISFNESFMAAFKALFIALFYSLVLYAGVSIIIAGINTLLFPVDSDAYAHAANIIFVLFATIYFLALIPVYPKGKENDEEDIRKEEIAHSKAVCPRFLEVLISYIIIPLTAVFTVILLIYIIINIGGRFWTDNLLEPMLVAYSIVVIIVYILSSRLNNNFAMLFKKIVPKAMIPIVVFQTVASILKISDSGITHSRYYAILYGIFAALAGIAFSILPVEKNGIVAAMLIVFSTISVVPPVDAFTVSRINQINRLEDVLIKNNMLQNNQVTPNSSLSSEDKQKITGAINYLEKMEYTKYISWLPEDYDFYSTFGFSRYDLPDKDRTYINLVLEQGAPVNIEGYDYLFRTSIFFAGQEGTTEQLGVIEKDGVKYTLNKKVSGGVCDIYISDQAGNTVISASTKEFFERFEDYSSISTVISVEEATYRVENGRASIAIVLQILDMEQNSDTTYYNAEVYVLAGIK